MEDLSAGYSDAAAKGKGKGKGNGGPPPLSKTKGSPPPAAKAAVLQSTGPRRSLAEEMAAKQLRKVEDPERKQAEVEKEIEELTKNAFAAQQAEDLEKATALQRRIAELKQDLVEVEIQKQIQNPQEQTAASLKARSRLGQIFPGQAYPCRLCIVVHCRIGDKTHALEQAGIAFTNGADGIFLMIMLPSAPCDLLEIYDAVRSEYPLRFIGLNFLFPGSLETAMENVPMDCQALWTDSGIDGKERQHGVDALVPKALALRATREWPGLLFAAFAFKGQQVTLSGDLMRRRAPIAAQIFDVPTTSGEATGVAMSIKRAASLREAVGTDAVLAVASGISSENAVDLVPFFDIVLAASSVEDGEQYSGVLNPGKVRALAELVHMSRQ